MLYNSPTSTGDPMNRTRILTALIMLLALSCASEKEDEANAGVDANADTEKIQDAGTEPDPWDHAARVGAFWGEAPDKETRLKIFDDICSILAEDYAGFVVLDLDWDEVREKYRPQVEKAESYGHFYALLSYMIAELHDVHTRIDSEKICGEIFYDNPSLGERPPMLRHYSNSSSSMGVCVTPMDDDRLLVYRVDPDNPAGLVPGDIILGYNGRPWHDLLDEIYDMKLPVCGAGRSSQKSHEYHQMYIAIHNAHLFEKMDVIRWGSSSPESIDTDDLLDFNSHILCSEQVGVEGVDLPYTSWDDYKAKPGITWGILPDTNIGYFYVYGPPLQAQEDFAVALEEMMDTDGMIIDQRYSHGGFMCPDFFSILLNDQKDIEHIIGSVERTDPDDFYAMSLDSVWWADGDIDIDESTYYDHPIAILQGPLAGSAADIFPYILSHHPRARRFGRITDGSFGAIGTFWAYDPYIEDIGFGYTSSIFVDSELDYLQGSEQHPEEEVWLDPDDVANGIDTVVEAALAWIEEENNRK